MTSKHRAILQVVIGLWLTLIGLSSAVLLLLAILGRDSLCVGPLLRLDYIIPARIGVCWITGVAD